MKEIVIVTDARRNLVAEITEVLAEAGVNIEFLSAEIIGRSRVAILTVDRHAEALQALARTPYQAISEDAFVIRLDDKPGELARIARRFTDAGIEIRSLRIIRYEGGTGIFAVSADRTEEAMELVKDVLISRQ
jgi:histidine decarboxylase